MSPEEAEAACSDLLRQLHELIAAGRDEGPEGEAIRDRMDRPWHAMGGAGRQRIRQLSEDLYEQAGM